MPFGDQLLRLATILLAAFWALGWVLLLVITALEHALPNREKGLERVRQTTARLLEPPLKYALWAVGILLAIRIIAEFLGWAPLLDSGDPGDQ